MRWDGIKVMVTGATGFLGSHLVERLVAQGAAVTALSRRDAALSPDGAQWIKADLGDFEQVRDVFGRCRPEWIFHLSSQADGRPDLGLAVPILRAEVVPTVHVLSAASESKVRRLILPGSLEEPDPGEVASSPYAAAKAASRLYANMFYLLDRLPVVIARIFMAYGPRQPAWKVIPSVARALLRGEAPEVGSPMRAVDWIYVSDVVDGMIRLAEVEGVEGKTVDIGTGALATVREVVEILVELTQAPVTPRYARVPARRLERTVRADSDATRREIGWSAQVSLRDGLRRTLDALRMEEARSGAAGDRSI